jgi:release factor glutamine methyltransferase
MNKTFKEVLDYYYSKAIELDKETSAIHYLFLSLFNFDSTIAFFNSQSNKVMEGKMLEIFEDSCNQYFSDIPVQYITNKSFFHGYDFYVDNRVLIPRSETEELVEKVIYDINHFFKDQKIRILDLGCGSGAIGLTIKKEIPNASVILADISSDALDVARINAKNLGVDVEFVTSNWFSNISGTFDCIISNPPYVKYNEQIQEIVRKEPNVALFTNKIDSYKAIIDSIKGYLKPNSFFCFEHGYKDGYSIRRYIKSKLGLNSFTSKDLNNKNRYTFSYLGKLYHQGELFIFPTDTVYGLGCRIDDLKGVSKIFSIKKRSIDKRLPCVFDSIESIKKYCTLSNIEESLLKKYSPGALSIILKTNDYGKSILDSTSVAVRIPNHKIILERLKDLGPLRLTSLNSSGEAEIFDYNQILKLFSNLVDNIYTDCELTKGISSTIIQIVDNNIKVLREGTITESEINNFLEESK